MEHQNVSAEASSLSREFSRLFEPDGGLSSKTVVLAAVLAVPLLLVLIRKYLYPAFDPREPPVIRPRVPFFGHVYSLLTEGNSFYVRLFKDNGRLPICTIPMLNGKMYVINSPSLIQAAMKNSKAFSFDPFMLEYAERVVGMKEEHVKAVAEKEWLDKWWHVIHSGLSREPVYRMSAVALRDVARELNAVDPTSTLVIPDLHVWLRKLIGVATFNGLFGEKNPLGVEALDCIGAFEKKVLVLGVDAFPKIFARDAIRGRKRVQDMLRPFFFADLDRGDDVSAIIRGRTRTEREMGIPPENRADIEFLLPFAGTSNTIPTLLWLFLQVFSRPELVDAVREEVLEHAVKMVETADCDDDNSKGKRSKIATIDMIAIENRCELTMACYREILRTSNDNVGNRRVMFDTVLRDTDGTEYLLKKGVNVQWCSRVNHVDASIWGPDADKYDPYRFLESRAGSPSEEKLKKMSMIPFGGGKTLCPGRYFALSESLGLVAALAVGFEVEGASVPPSLVPNPALAVRQPDWGSLDPGVKIRRRKGWEDVVWDYSFLKEGMTAPQTVI